MKIKVDPEHKDYKSIISTKQSVIASVLTAKVRIDEAGLRKANDNRFERLLQMLKEQEKKLGLKAN